MPARKIKTFVACGAAAGISAVGVAIGPGAAGLMVTDSGYPALGGFVIACGLGAAALILPVARAVDSC